jgi:methionine synthase II (cobalamin-independent)
VTSRPDIWRAGTATGVGSWPGEDPLEAARFVLGELPIPYLPELPGRGWNADLAGRSAALLADLYVDVQPSGWRITPRPSRDGQRAKDLLARDLDAFEQAALDSPPAVLKVQVAGPWTLAAVLELHRGAKLLSDHGAILDLAASLAEGLAAHLADVQRRLPGTTVVLQLDEPALPGVLAAHIPTASGFGTLRAPDPQIARERLRTVLKVAEHTVIHCCAPRPPIDLMAEAGAISVDVAMLDPRDDDALGVALERGKGLLLGVLPATDAALPSVGEVVNAVGRLRDRVGMTDVTLTPACGLGGATEDYARAATERCVQAAAAVEQEQR